MFNDLNPRLQNPHVGLVDVFHAPDIIRKSHPRVVADVADLYGKYVFPLSADARRAKGQPAMVSSFDDFKTNWSLFTESSLSHLTDWSNIVAAGGSVQACLTPLPHYVKTSDFTARKYYHDCAFPSSDIDIFLYGMTPA